MKIKAVKNGPYLIEIAGKVKILREGESRETEGKMVALCRCGHSKNKPMCDGSHAKVGFSAEEAEIELP